MKGQTGGGRGGGRGGGGGGGGGCMSICNIYLRSMLSDVDNAIITISWVALKIDWSYTNL